MARNWLAGVALAALLSGCTLYDDLVEEKFSRGASATYYQVDRVEALRRDTDALLIQFAALAGYDLPGSSDAAKAAGLPVWKAVGPGEKPEVRLLVDPSLDPELAEASGTLRQLAYGLQERRRSIADTQASKAKIEAIPEKDRKPDETRQLERHNQTLREQLARLAEEEKAYDEAARSYLAKYQATYGYFWQRVTEAGFLYIDSACADYIDLIYDMHKTLGAAQGGLAVLGAGTAGLLSVFDASAGTFAAIAISLGIAAGLLDVAYDSLLFKLDPATVKILIASMQDAIRTYYNRAGYLPVSKTETLLVLGRYLDACVPPTIEAEVNRQLQNLHYKQVRGGAAPEDRIKQFDDLVDDSKTLFGDTRTLLQTTD